MINKKLILISALLSVALGCENKEIEPAKPELAPAKPELAPAPVFTGSEVDLKKFKALNACEGCDLSGADLKGANLNYAQLNDANLENANLRNANLSGLNLATNNLKNAKLDEAKFCKTQMPWGEVNDDCGE